MSYDKDKVAPRPWRLQTDTWDHGHESGTRIYGANDKWLSDGHSHDDPDDCHIVHCVNHHDPLVEALDTALNLLDLSVPAAFTCEELESIDPQVSELSKVLRAAKEEPDGT